VLRDACAVTSIHLAFASSEAFGVELACSTLPLGCFAQLPGVPRGVAGRSTRVVRVGHERDS
jgi:hypothetical protein